MADIQMPKSIPCKFDARGYAPCKKLTDNGLCTKHEKTKCRVCGDQALRTCDVGMGGLCCGVPLCETCQHSMESGGDHVTKEVYAVQLKERQELKQTGKESLRMLALRGVRIDITLPRHVGDIIDTSPPGFSVESCYTALVNSSHVFPVILEDTRIPLITLDKRALINVLYTLPPKNFKITCTLWMVNMKLGVCYRYDNDAFGRTQSRPHKLFSTKEINTHLKKAKKPFVWAPGLIGGDISKSLFCDLLMKESALKA